MKGDPRRHGGVHGRGDEHRVASLGRGDAAAQVDDRPLGHRAHRVEHDLSLTQLRVLAILRDREPMMVERAAHLGLERSAVSGPVDRAVRRGLVRRDASEKDGRAVRVALTPDGRRLAGCHHREGRRPAHADDPRPGGRPTVGASAVSWPG